MEDPFADVTHGEALDRSGPSTVNEAQHIFVSSGVTHHLAETTADVAEVVASQTATVSGKRTKTPKGFESVHRGAGHLIGTQFRNGGVGQGS